VTGHHVGLKCPALRSHHMHVKLSMSSYLDTIKRLPVTPSDDCTILDSRIHPTFIHVLGPVSTNNANMSLSNEPFPMYICELYKHSQDNLGKWLVGEQQIARYVERMRIFVYTSGVDGTRPEMSITSTTKRPQSMGVLNNVEELRQIHTRRKEGRCSWLESRIARITGTSAALVMTGKTFTGIGMKQLFGLSTFSPTLPMKIGTILEAKILKSYAADQNLSLNTPKGLVLGDKEYIGHTPDGIMRYPHREVLEVKVIFNKISVDKMYKQHEHQLQLGLLVHKCKKGRLLVYVPPSNMTESEAATHVVDLAHLEVASFQKDDEWMARFTQKSHEFYTEHLMWFYRQEFDTEAALKLVNSLMANAQTKSKSTKRTKLK
jgi:hypothetical protein